MAIFRPTARVRIQLRIDEMAETQSVLRSLEREPPGGASLAQTVATAAADIGEALATNLQKRFGLESMRGALRRSERERELSMLNQERSALQTGPARAEQTRPMSLVEQPNDAKNVLFEMLPEEVTISRNGLQDADTADITLTYQDLPIDPRVVRAALVSISIGSVSADDYQDGVVLQRVRETDGSLASMVEHVPGEELRWDTPTTFVGFVDEWGTEFGEDDTVKLKCRDVSALLRDIKILNTDGIDLSLPVDAGISALLDRFPATRGLRVVYGTPQDETDPLNRIKLLFSFPPPVPARSMQDLLREKPAKGKRPTQKKTSKEESLWDHISKILSQLGLIPVFRGFTLFIMEPRLVYSDLVGNKRRMVWGRNISKLGFARKLAGRKNDTIEVRCPDPSIGRTRWARYPVLGNEPRSGVLGLQGSPQPVTTRANEVSPNGVGQESVTVMTVQGVTDGAVLERIAQSTFEQIARQEIEGYLETHEITSFDSDEEADLLRLMPGDPITVQVAPPVELAPVDTAVSVGQRSAGNNGARPVTATTLQELQAQSAAMRQQYLERLGMSTQTARRLAAAQEQVALIETFRAGNVNISWSADDGVVIDVDFHNFVVIRDGEEAVN